MESWPIFAIGFLAQLLFSARLISQWFLSEKSKEVETPVLFWKLSLLASILLFTYGYLRDDFAIMLGQDWVVNATRIKRRIFFIDYITKKSCSILGNLAC